jgi:hypothetical protein
MSTRVVLGLVAAVATAVTPVLVAGQSTTGQSAPRQSAAAPAPDQVPMTPWGHPDLQGTWDYRSITPLERPARFGDRALLTEEEVKEMEERAAKRMDEPPPDDAPAGTIHAQYWTDPGRYVEDSRRTSLIVDPPNGRVPPLTEEARSRQGGGRRGGAGPNRQGGRADSWLDRSPLERCITWGLPTAILPGLYNNNIEIVQSPTEVAIIHEMVHDTRVIPLDGRPHLSAALGQWMGHSRAHWEGSTLVVETTNFSPKISYRGASPNLRLIERFTRMGPDRIEFALTVEDPSTWVAPWTARYSMRPSEGPLFEYACHEGNYGLRNILEVARDEEKAAAEAAGQK